MFISGVIVAALTFPGIIIHELGHLLLCRLTGVRVNAYALLQMQEPYGYVIHEEPDSVFKNFLITFGPFFVNTIAIAAFLVLGTFVSTFVSIAGWIFVWLAISAGMHSFPSKQDANSLWTQMWGTVKQGKALNLVFAPFVALIYLGSLLSVLWIDLIYTMVVAGAVLSATSMPFWVNINNGIDVSFSHGNTTYYGMGVVFDDNLVGYISERGCDKRACKLHVPRSKIIWVTSSNIKENAMHTIVFGDSENCMKKKITDTELKSAWFGHVKVDVESGQQLDAKECILAFQENIGTAQSWAPGASTYRVS